jgi:flagellar hook-basal body complex protein FliE
MVIKGIESVTDVGNVFPSPLATGAKPASPAEGFSKYLGEMVQKVKSSQQEADSAIQQLVTGEAKGLHEVMIAMEKSSISFQFLTQVRNKAVDAYQEIMRMPV